MVPERQRDPPRGVIFDLDGTLANSLEDIAAAMNHVLHDAGLPTHPQVAYRGFVGRGADVLVERATPAAQHGHLRELKAAFVLRYAAHLLDCTRAYDGIDELLERLCSCAVPLAVLSNKPEDLTRRVVTRLFGSVPFRAVVGQRPGVPKKPDPTAALDIAQSIALPPDQLAFVGDTAIDVATAVAAGMLPVGVVWGFRGRDELVEAGAAALLARPAQLLTVLGLGGPAAPER